VKKDLAYYRKLPYTRRAVPIIEGPGRPYWLASVEELRGCKADGVSLAEAMANLDAAFDDYIEAMIGWGTPVPEPARRPKEGNPIPYVAAVQVTKTTAQWAYSRLGLGSPVGPLGESRETADRMDTLNAAEAVEVG
jgi:predicted RNase H-like HicB family nuclease